MGTMVPSTLMPLPPSVLSLTLNGLTTTQLLSTTRSSTSAVSTTQVLPHLPSSLTEAAGTSAPPSSALATKDGKTPSVTSTPTSVPVEPTSVLATLPAPTPQDPTLAN